MGEADRDNRAVLLKFAVDYLGKTESVLRCWDGSREEIPDARRGCRVEGRRGPFSSLSTLPVSIRWQKSACRDLQRPPTNLFVKARRAVRGDSFRPRMQCLLYLGTQFQISKEGGPGDDDNLKPKPRGK